MHEPPTTIDPAPPRIRTPRTIEPTQDPALLQPQIPGIRRVFQITGSLAASTTLRNATQLIPARTIIRTIYYAIDGALTYANSARLSLAFGNTLTPVATDFIGTGRILPDSGPAGTTGVYSADPANAAQPKIVNYQLPNREARLLFEIINANLQSIFYRLRIQYDALGRLGPAHERR